MSSVLIYLRDQAKAQFKRRSTANNVEILVPVPEDADSPRFRTNIGTVHYAPEKSAIIWKIKQFGGGKEFLMRAELGLPSVKGDDEHGGGMTGGFGGSMGGAGAGKSKRPINVKFEIPYFTTSGIQVRYLKITEPKVGVLSPIINLEKNLYSLAASCNTPPFPGSAISHSQAISPFACRTCNKEFSIYMSDLYSLSSFHTLPFPPFPDIMCSLLWTAGPIDNTILMCLSVLFTFVSAT